jgi:hypothetical protein
MSRGQSSLAEEQAAYASERRAGRSPIWKWAFRILLIAGAAVVAYVWYSGSHVDSRTYGAADLANGPITQIIPWDDGRTAVQVSRLTDLPADQLWKVVTDQGRFDQFMPYVRKTTVEPLPGGKLLEKQILDLPHATYNVELEIALDQQPGVRKARWRQINESLTYNQGAWVVEESGGKSILRYQVAAGVDWMPQFVVNFSLRPRLNRLLQAVEQRVRDLNAKEPQYFQ